MRRFRAYIVTAEKQNVLYILVFITPNKEWPLSVFL